MNGIGNESRVGDHQVLLGLGSNINPQQYLPEAVDLLMEYVWIEAISTAWDTPAVGIQAPDFLNAALLIDTSLDSPVALKQTVIRPVEACLGRVRTPNKNASRSIDIDVIIFDGQVLESQLWTEAFLAVPAAELVPNLFYPLTGETLTQIAQRLARCTRIEPRPEVLPGKWGDQQE